MGAQSQQSRRRQRRRVISTRNPKTLNTKTELRTLKQDPLVLAMQIKDCSAFSELQTLVGLDPQPQTLPPKPETLNSKL